MKSQKQATKEITVLARVEFKNDPRKVCYQVLSSNDTDKYITCLFNGKACSCSCPATKPCYHMVQLEAREQARRQPVQPEKANPVAEAQAFIAKVQAEKATKAPAPRQQEDWSTSSGSLYRETRNYETVNGRACPMR